MAVGNNNVHYVCFLKVINGDIPPEVFSLAAVNKDMTSSCYGSANILFTATSSGVVCVWNLNNKKCLMHWQADDEEIG